MGISDSSLGRRQFAGLAAAAVTVPLVGLVPVAEARDQRLRLRRDSGSVVSALDVPLTTTAAGRAMRPGRAVRTPVMETTRFTLLGVTWESGRARVRARVRRVGGGWTAWQELAELHDGPDPDTGEGRATPHATHPTWVGAADAVQLEVSGAPVRPVLALVDGGRKSTDAVAGLSSGSRTPRLARGRRPRRAPRPELRSRVDWGANPRLRSSSYHRNHTLKQVHVHHTASSNDYSRSDVPAIIRSMYRYHTKSLGWSDIGYNYLVDRFGRTWIGRRGSGRHLVRGAHTLGFNHASMGVAVIGNFDKRRPNEHVITAIVRLAAWLLDFHDRDPLGRIEMRSHGSDRYRAGKHVLLPVIDGHRDTNETACPGRYLYAELPRIRRRTARRIRRFKPVQRPER